MGNGSKHSATDRFRVRYWGVRGSCPTPGPDTVRYGGNTSCVEVRCGDEVLILDAGSGLRALGVSLRQEMNPVRATMLFTHLHWDHIQGFPFFMPAFIAGNELHIYGEERTNMSLLDVLRGQQMQPTFPVSLDDMGATMHFHALPRGGSFDIGEIRVTTAPLHHPGEATAYRIDYRGRSFVHASDHEHQGELHRPLVELARGADVLSYDATYTNAEYLGERGMSHVGWGHSTWEEAVKMAHAAAVRQLVLFHHDPEHSDDQMDGIGHSARERFANTVVAYEGMVIDLL